MAKGRTQQRQHRKPFACKRSHILLTIFVMLAAAPAGLLFARSIFGTPGVAQKGVRAASTSRVLLSADQNMAGPALAKPRKIIKKLLSREQSEVSVPTFFSIQQLLPQRWWYHHAGPAVGPL